MELDLYHQHKRFLKKHGIKISTITVNCHLGTDIELHVFIENIKLSKRGVLSKKYGDPSDPRFNAHLKCVESSLKTPKKKKTKKKKKGTNRFLHQATIRMYSQIEGNNLLNIKVFQNGTLQVTGCKDIDDLVNVANNLIEILKNGVSPDNEPYVLEPDKLALSDIKIRMINSDFNVGFEIDKDNFVKILIKNHGYDSINEIGWVLFINNPEKHSGIQIKYDYSLSEKESKIATIIVFKSGSVIITGACNLQQIISSYEYITNLIDIYKPVIRLKKLKLSKLADQVKDYHKLEKKKKRSLNYHL